MAHEWSSRPLRDCAKWYSGGTPSKSNQAYWNGSIPWISAKSLKEFFVRESEDKVTESGAGNGTRLVPENSILFIVRGMSLKSEFRMGITTKPVTFNQDLKALVAHEDINPKFLAYAIKGREKEILGLVGEAGHGTGVLPTDRIEGLEILLPPEDEQSAIAHVLGTLDDKIELSRKQNETLEAMARALFKAWFVDFEPVRAKMEGRWQRSQSLPGLPAHLYDLFPDRLVDSELGGIPEGWEMRTVGDFADLQGGKQLEKDRIVPNGEIPVFGGAGVMGYTDTYNADGFVIAVGRVGAYCGQFFSHRGKAWINNNASLIRQKKEDFGEWLFLSLRHADIDVIKKGAAQPFVSNGDLSKLPLVWPSEKVVESFLQFTVPLLKGQEDANRESKFLALLRDTLLPKLISGELRIRDAERILEEASP